MDNIQFVQCAHFGVTFGFRFDGGTLYLAAGFAHKESPEGSRKNFEQFSRRTGRSVVKGRLDWLIAESQEEPPFAVRIDTALEGKGSAAAVRKSIWSLIDRLQNTQVPAEFSEEQRDEALVACNASTIGYDDQIENDQIFDFVTEALQDDDALQRHQAAFVAERA